MYFSTHAEYILYKKDNIPQPITDLNEYQQLYSVLMNYQWPMVVGYAKHMTQQELMEISESKENAEESFIRKKLKAISPTYDIVFIPTVIYELFVIYSFRKNTIKSLKDIEQLSQDNYSACCNAEFLFKLMSNPNSTHQEWYDRYRETNSKQIIYHQAINNALLEYLVSFESNGDLKSIFKHKQSAIINDIISKVKDEKYNTFIKIIENPVHLEKFIDIEYDAYRNNKGLLYRGGRSDEAYIVGYKKNESKKRPIEMHFLSEGSKKSIPSLDELEDSLKKGGKSLKWVPWQSTEVSQEHPTGTISYGNSLLAGFFNDTDACAAKYYDESDRLGYILFIDKRQFLTGTLHSLFNLSLLNTLTGLFCRGELFHSRTVSYATQAYKEYFEKDPKKTVGSLPGLDTEYLLPFDKSGLFIRIGDPLQKVYEFSDYVAHNARIVKSPNNIWFPTLSVTDPYFKAQAELTNMFKAMITLRKYVSK